jgi:hypothetical protein
MFSFTQADQTTSSLTAVDIPNFSFPLNGNGEKWEFEFTLIIGSDSIAGVKFALRAPTGANFRAWAVGSGAAKSTILVDLMNTSGALGAAFNTFIATGNYLSIRGGVINGTFGGNMQLQAAKVTSGTATLSAGSYFTAALIG